MSFLSIITGRSRIEIGDQTYIAEHTEFGTKTLPQVVSIDAGENYVVARGNTRKEALETAKEVLTKQLKQSQ